MDFTTTSQMYYISNDLSFDLCNIFNAFFKVDGGEFETNPYLMKIGWEMTEKFAKKCPEISVTATMYDISAANQAYE